MNVKLGGIAMDLLAQADDILLMSYSAAGLQSKLHVLQKWCSDSFIQINKVKTVVMMFNARKNAAIPTFRVGTDTLELSECEKYVGVEFDSARGKPMFESHRRTKAAAARYIGHTIMSMEVKTGHLPPMDIKKQYSARMDPHLIYGCEIMPNEYKASIKELETVQRRFLRRMLGVSKRSMVMPLFSETGITPLECRQFIIVLVYLHYLVGRDTDKYVRGAFESSRELAKRGKTSWLKAVNGAAQKLPFECPAVDLDICDSRAVDAIKAAVVKNMNAWVLEQTEGLGKLYLIHGRREPRKDSDKPPVRIALTLRHYLEVDVTDYERAITSVVLSTHKLALEKLRYRDHSRPKIPRGQRLCRMCGGAVESPEHVLIECQANQDIVALRTDYRNGLARSEPGIVASWDRSDTCQVLKSIIASRNATFFSAKYMHRVLKIVYAIPLVIASGTVVTQGHVDCEASDSEGSLSDNDVDMN